MKLVAAGAAAWAVGLVVLLVLRATETAEVRDWWLGMCCYGVALGLFGVYYCRRRHLAIERERAQADSRLS